MPQTFNDYDVRPLIGPLWRAGGPNSAATATSAQIKVSSLALTAGDTYEVEAALAETAGHARALAVVQDLFRVKRQLTPPVDPNLLYERRPPRITALQPLETLALFAVGERAEERLGLGQPREPLGLDEEAQRRRQAVRGLRADGWPGAIVLPSFVPEMQIVVVPRAILQGGNLRVGWTGTLSSVVPPTLVDFTLGLRESYPQGGTITGAQLSSAPRRQPTISWQPKRSPATSDLAS